MSENNILKGTIALIIVSLIISFGYIFSIKYGMKVIKPKKEFKYHFVLIGEEKDNPLWKEIRKGAEEAASEYGIGLEYLEPNVNNIKEQQELLDMAFKSKVDGIIMNGYENEEIKEIIKKAYGKDIPTILLNDEVNLSNRICYIGINNYKAGMIAVDELKKQRRDFIKIGIITRESEYVGEDLKLSGIIKGIKENPTMKLSAIRTFSGSKIQLYNEIVSMIRENPEINAIIGGEIYDTSIIGKVLVDLNKVGEISVVGYDYLDETLRYIKKGVVSSAISRNPYEIGYKSIEILNRYKNEEFIDDVFYVDVDVINAGNIDEYYGEDENE